MVPLQNRPVLRSHHPSIRRQDIPQANRLPDIHLTNHSTMDGYDKGRFIQMKHAGVAY